MIALMVVGLMEILVYLVQVLLILAKPIVNLNMLVVMTQQHAIIVMELQAIIVSHQLAIA